MTIHKLTNGDIMSIHLLTTVMSPGSK